MACITMNYMVTHEGFRGTVINKDGETLYTRLFPACDKGLLENALDGMKRDGEITEYSIDWVTVKVKAGE